MPNFSNASHRRPPRRRSTRTDKPIVWTFSNPSRGVLLWTSLHLQPGSALSLHFRSPRFRKSTLRLALERSRLSEEGLAQPTIHHALYVRFGSNENRGHSPLRDVSFRVPCEALLFASPAPNGIVRNRIGAFGWLQTSSKKMQSPILAVCSLVYNRNFINGLVSHCLRAHSFVRSQACAAPNRVPPSQKRTAQECVYINKTMQYKNVCVMTTQNNAAQICVWHSFGAGKEVVWSNSL
jgi:hypothetical protein